MFVSLIVPAYNEEVRIVCTLEKYCQHLREHYPDAFEILVVVNGSSDHTAEVAQAYAETNPEVRVINIPEAIGKGGAVLEGFRQAVGRSIAFADADGSTSPQSITSLLAELKDSDIVIGSRWQHNSQVLVKQPLHRRVFSRVFNFSVRSLFYLPFKDTQCGAKAFRSSAAKALSELVTEHYWTFDVDLLIKARSCGFRIKEVPVVWEDQQGSKVRFLSTSRDVMFSFWKMKRSSAHQAADRKLEKAPSVTVRDSISPKKSYHVLALNWRSLDHPQAGGSEINIFEQARRWVCQGHQVTLICADPGRKHAPEKKNVVDGIHVRRMGNQFTVYLLALLYYLRHSSEFDFIVDVSNGIPFFTPIVARIPGVLLIHHVHGLQWFREFPYLFGALGWYLESRVVPKLYGHWRTIAVSPTTYDSLMDLGFDPENLSIVYNGVNKPEMIPVTGTPAADKQGPTIAYVGRLKRYKRIDRLVRMMPELKQRVPGVHLVIAGDGDAREEIETIVHDMGLDDSVTIHGFVEDSTKAEILSNATVFATPSMHEGWGLSVIEANSFGCPAVAYDVPGLRTSIRNGETGLLAIDDPSFKEGLVKLLTDEELRNNLSEEAVNWANQFSWDTTAQQTLEILQESN